MLKKALLVLGLVAVVFAFAAMPAHAEPKFGLLGTPYSTWGDLRYDVTDRRHGGEGLHFQGHIEQGLEIAQFGSQDRFHLIPFVDFDLKLGQDPQIFSWNNKVQEGFGMKVRYNVFESGRHGGVIDLGVRGTHTSYINGANGSVDGLGGQVFLTYWFGGDWTKK